MKTRRIILIVAAAMSLFAAQSCLKDQKMVFDKPYSERMSDYLKNVTEVLESNESGWIMRTYPGTGQAYGGYAFYVNFKDGKVTARCEIDPEYEETSYYKLTNDNGPVLSFDLHNEILHLFSTPSSGAYQAMGGDFEFTIKEYSNEKIGLVGKRSGNHCDLYPFPVGIAPEKYLQDVYDMSENVLAATVDGVIGGKEVTGEVDLDSRRITFTYYDPEEAALIAAGDPANEEEEDGDDEEGYVTKEMPFMYTPTGIRAYEPVKIAGNTLDDLMYHSENNVFTNGVIVLQGHVPADYTQYADFEGTYTLKYNSTATVTLTPNEDKTGYIMSGINKNYTIFLKYNKAKGRLMWNAQVVGSNGDNLIWLAAWDLNGGGSLTWNDVAGTEIHWVEERGRFEFESNKDWEGHSTDSFILWETDANGKSIGQYTGWGSSQIPYLNYLKRK
ncbi:MAG: DUF4302 domain-containing protein [Bacteroidales bacterium]|nr:DUF4302 domain-containing protein [Bacteroidales bacterium]